MNIGTGSLFKILTSKLDSVLNDKIEEKNSTTIKLENKDSITSMIKEKTMQVVLNSFFKELSNDKKTSSSIRDILETNKKNFDIKNMKSEINGIVKFLETQPKLAKQLSALKEFLVDIETIDEKKLKTMIKNSGVFLESKLLKSDTPLSSDIKAGLSNIKDLLDSYDIEDDLDIDQEVKTKRIVDFQKRVVDLKNSFDNILEKIDNIQEDELPKIVKDEIKNKLFEFKDNISTINNTTPKERAIPLLQNIEKYLTTIMDEFSKIELPTKTFFVNNTLLDSKSIVSTDLKTIILQIGEYIDENENIELPKELKTQIEKVQIQIEYFQLLSIVSNANYTSLPFDWDNIEHTDIKFDKVKDNFSCQINLQLKKQGELRVLLQLDNKKNLEINIGVESEEFKLNIQENLQKLRVGINSIGLMINGLNVFSLYEKTKSYEQNIYEDQSNKKIDFGYDIKV